MTDFNLVTEQLDIISRDLHRFTTGLTDALSGSGGTLSEYSLKSFEKTLGILTTRKNDTLREVGTLIGILQSSKDDLEEAVASAEQVLSEAQASKADTLEIEGSTFKRLLDLGRITKLEGTIKSDWTAVQELRLNNIGAIRPPVEYISDDALFNISDIVLEMTSGTVLDKDAISVIVKF